MARKRILHEKPFQISFSLNFAFGVFAMLFFLTLAAAAPLWMVQDYAGLSQISRSILKEGLRHVLGLGALISLGGMAGAFGFGLFLSNRYIGPLARLENWVRDVAKDPSSAPPGVRDKDLLKNIVDALHFLARKGGK